VSESITVKAGQLECLIDHDSGKFNAFIVIDGGRTPVLEGRVPMTVAADAATHEAVHALARVTVERLVALLMPGVKFGITARQ
jgi:hypothetical protein